MLDNLFKIKMFVPSVVTESIFTLDWEKLYREGKRYLFFDLDNTLAPCGSNKPSSNVCLKIGEIKRLGFTVLLVSNSIQKRVKSFAESLNISFVRGALKPFSCGIKKGIKLWQIKDLNEIVCIGDQLMTDILAANRLKIDSVLVSPWDLKTDKKITKLNRKREAHILMRLERINPALAKTIKENYERGNIC